MSTKQRNIQILLSGIILICALVCACFGWHHSLHSKAWNRAFYGLLLLSSFISCWRIANSNKPVPDTLISLFPKPTQETPGKIMSK
jgi:uncharacterized membrane protein (UPF0136 family)